MTDLDFIVTSNMLRTAIRAKLAVGVTQRTIWLLIAHFARDGAKTRQREEGGVHRLPVEIISHERRAAFLDALNELSEQGLPSAVRAAQAAQVQIAPRL